MAFQPSAIAGDGDPRLSLSQDNKEARTAHQPVRGLEPRVSFEAFVYWAHVTRADEQAADRAFREARGPRTVRSVLRGRFASAPKAVSGGGRAGVSLQEWTVASRAMRTASWGAVFYLITTDVLGPSSTAWAFSQMGYGPGAALYTVFGAMAGYSGWIMWKTFLGLDSDRYPLRTYGDLFLRIFGRASQHIVNTMLALEMVLSVALLILSNGQSISQISQGMGGGNGICFVACLVIFMAAGLVVGQIRTLQRFAWIANLNVWMNLVIIFICMGVVVHSPPNFKATQASFGKDFGPGPVKTFAGTPPDGYASGGTGFVASLNGLNQAIYSYGGCLAFVAFLAEMRQPMDFWKALLCGQLFIYSVYIIFGMYIYSFQGQYSFNPVMQGLSPYGFQTATNILNIITSLIAAALYGNIGFKVVYSEVLQDICDFPPLTEKKGKVAWAVLMPLYWALAFVVAAAVPQFSYVSGLISAFFILSFTYTFPALLALGYWVKKDAMAAEERFDPQTGTYNYMDTGVARLKRGFMKRPLFNLLNLVYTLGSLVTTGLGVYSSIEGLVAAFSGKSSATSFGCNPPV